MPAMTLTLPEELLLVALDDDKGSVHSSEAIDVGLAGARLLELTLAGRLEIEDKRIVVRDASPTGDADLDDALELISASSKARKPDHWVGKLKKGARDATLARLVDRGLVRPEEQKVLGVIPVTRHPAVDDRLEREIRGRVRQVLVHGAEPSERTGALVSLLHACDLVDDAVPKEDKRDAKRRAKEIAKGEQVGKAVSTSVMATQAAVIAATTTASSDGGGGGDGGGGS